MRVGVGWEILQAILPATQVTYVKWRYIQGMLGIQGGVLILVLGVGEVGKSFWRGIICTELKFDKDLALQSEDWP